MKPLRSRRLSLGYSPCPNDTFVFDALAHGRVGRPNFEIESHLHDVETLNRMAMSSCLDITKLSFYAWLHLRDRYRMLDAGAAMGFGCGPVLIAERPIDPEALGRCRVVLPGRWTTAHLLFRLWAPGAGKRVFAPYHEIMSWIRTGKADCGVIIHENRFTYQESGFEALVDLGQWWEQLTGLPIPLGCIAARRDLPEALTDALTAAIRASIRRAREHPAECRAYIRKHAQEMDETVIQQHIETFVNDYSFTLGDTGRRAVAALEKHAIRAGVIQ